jgi:hypothetical protein
MIYVCYNPTRRLCNRKGKPGENRGRKAMGLSSQNCGYDCQVAEVMLFI